MEKRDSTFYYWLDPIRAVSALLVLFVHARSVIFVLYKDLEPSSQTIFTQLFYFICSLGSFSVCMFYILSGFLVGGKTIDKIRLGNVCAKQFFLNRVFRIGVPLTGALILISIVNFILDIKVGWGELMGQYLGLQGIFFSDAGGVFWTLPYEIWFYIFLFALILFFCNMRIFLGMLMGAISMVVFSCLLPQFLYIIILGILCYYARIYKMYSRQKLALWISLPILFLLYFCSSLNYLGVKFGYSDSSIWINPCLQILLFAVIALIISQYVLEKPIGKISIAINKYGGKMAIFSYSLFLTHYQVLKFWIKYMPKHDSVNLHSMCDFIGVCGICIVVGYLMYLLFEKNTRSIQKWCEDKFKWDLR